MIIRWKRKNNLLECNSSRFDYKNERMNKNSGKNGIFSMEIISFGVIIMMMRISAYLQTKSRKFVVIRIENMLFVECLFFRENNKAIERLQRRRIFWRLFKIIARGGQFFYKIIF